MATGAASGARSSPTSPPAVSAPRTLTGCFSAGRTGLMTIAIRTQTTPPMWLVDVVDVSDRSTTGRTARERTPRSHGQEATEEHAHGD